MTSSINTKLWIIHLQPNNSNTHYYQSLSFLINVEFAPDYDLAMEGLESEVLQEIILFVQLWQTIKVLISMHVHYESANPNENPQRYFEADLKHHLQLLFISMIIII